MPTTKDDAKKVIDLIRRARDEYDRVGSGQACEKAKLIFLSLDVAELMTADEVSGDYQNPQLLVALGRLIEALDLWKKEMISRVRRHPESAELMR